MPISRRAAVLVAFVLAGCATAAPPQPPLVTPVNIIETRKATFGLSAAAFHHMRTRIDAGTDVTPLGFSARRLERWAKVLPSMFPPGTGAGTRAKPEVWTNRADFEAKAAVYATEAGKLAAMAEANDKAGFATQWKAVDASCASCHKAYRSEQ